MISFEQYFTSDPSFLEDYLDFKERYRNVMKALRGDSDDQKSEIDDEDYEQ